MPTTNGKIYLGEILLSGGGESTPDTWVRNPDWLTLPTLTAGVDEKVVGLFAVGDHGSNFVAFTMRGAYHVDWGDGNSEDVADNVKAEHNFDYSDLGAGTEFSSRW